MTTHEEWRIRAYMEGSTPVFLLDLPKASNLVSPRTIRVDSTERSTLDPLASLLIITNETLLTSPHTYHQTQCLQWNRWGEGVSHSFPLTITTILLTSTRPLHLNVPVLLVGFLVQEPLATFQEARVVLPLEG
jgi:hypothetical protein